MVYQTRSNAVSDSTDDDDVDVSEEEHVQPPVAEQATASTTSMPFTPTEHAGEQHTPGTNQGGTGFTPGQDWWTLDLDSSAVAAAATSAATLHAAQAAAAHAQAGLHQIPEEAPVAEHQIPEEAPVAGPGTGAQPRILFETPAQGMPDIEAATRENMVSEIVKQCIDSTKVLMHDMLEEMAEQQAIEAASLREKNIRA
jgi:hypothetical protein